MVNRRNPAAGDPYPLFDVGDRSVIITAATGALGSATDRLHHGRQPATACGGVEAVRPASPAPLPAHVEYGYST